MAVPVLTERKLTFVFPQEVQKLLVVARFEVEQLCDDLVVPARFLQPLADEVADVGSRDFALHVERVHGGPEGLAMLDKTLVEIVGDGAAPFTPRAMVPLVT